MPQPSYYPLLPTTFVADSDGYLLDPFSLEVEVRDDLGAVCMARVAVDLENYPAGDRLGPGYYRAASYNPQTDLIATVGRRTVTWFCVPVTGDDEVSWTTTTERLAVPKPWLGAPAYALIQDLRDEGFTTAALTDFRAHVLLHRATRYIEMFTGRRFVPEPRELRLLRSGGWPLLQLGEPIIAIDPDSAGVQNLLQTYERGSLRVYNRHLSARLMDPDDRENPKLEVYGGVWGFATYPVWQNSLWLSSVWVRGVWGYTDPDGSPMGSTPTLIKHVAILFVRRELAGVGSGFREDVTLSARVISERTRDQSVGYAAPGSIGGGRPGSPAFGAFTGDPEIDTILVSYRRQHKYAAV